MRKGRGERHREREREGNDLISIRYLLVTRASWAQPDVVAFLLYEMLQWVWQRPRQSVQLLRGVLILLTSCFPGIERSPLIIQEVTDKYMN